MRDAIDPPTAATPPLLLAPWSGPYGGLPPFDRVTLDDIEPALEAGMALCLAEIEAIATDPAPASFETVMVALERAGRPLARAEAVYYLWRSNLATPAFRALDARLSPRLSAFDDSIVHNAALFARVDAAWRACERAALTAEQRRLAWRIWNGYVRSGARLSAEDKAKLTAVNGELATLQTRFAQNALADEERMALLLDEPGQLAGLPDTLVAGFAADAAAHEAPGRWRIANTRSTIEPVLAGARDRDVRRRVFQMWTSRGDTGGDTDNNAVLAAILRLRAEKARLLGHPNYAVWHMADTMAGNPEAALELSMRVWRPAVAQVRRDLATMQALVDAEGGGFAIAPWDYRFYAERLRAERFDLDMGAVKRFLRLDRVRDAMFHAAGRLHGLTFTRAAEAPVFHPDVEVWTVSEGGGAPVGLWYFDPYARPGKSSGAWMTSYRVQSRFDGAVLPLVSCNANFVRGTDGAGVTLSWEDALTLFHEFGHALHALLSRVTYPRLAGTAVARDFVELPSQLNENWLATPEILARLTDEEGAAMPSALIQALLRAQAFNKGFSVVETQACALADMRLHMAGSEDAAIDPRAFEAAFRAELDMPVEIVLRHRLPHFSHVFAGEGYAAGYYGYLWAEVLERDAWEAFAETGDVWNVDVARRLRETVLAVGGTVDAADAWRAFRGRDPDVAPLLRRAGFA